MEIVFLIVFSQQFLIQAIPDTRRTQFDVFVHTTCPVMCEHGTALVHAWGRLI